MSPNREKTEEEVGRNATGGGQDETFYTSLQETIFIEPMTSDRELKAYREGLK